MKDNPWFGGKNCSNHNLIASFKKIFPVAWVYRYISLFHIPLRRQTDGPSLKCHTKGMSGKAFRTSYAKGTAPKFNKP